MTDVPCTTDLQCVGVPGTSCNTALAAPRCSKQQCAPLSAPCSSDGLCQIGLLCGDGTCREAQVSALALCLAACASASVSYFGGSNSSTCTDADRATGCSRICAGYPGAGWWQSTCNGDLSRPESFGKISFLECNKDTQRVCNAWVYCRNPDGIVVSRFSRHADTSVHVI